MFGFWRVSSVERNKAWDFDGLLIIMAAFKGSGGGGGGAIWKMRSLVQGLGPRLPANPNFESLALPSSARVPRNQSRFVGDS